MIAVPAPLRRASVLDMKLPLCGDAVAQDDSSTFRYVGPEVCVGRRPAGPAPSGWLPPGRPCCYVDRDLLQWWPRRRPAGEAAVPDRDICHPQADVRLHGGRCMAARGMVPGALGRLGERTIVAPSAAPRSMLERRC